jgi:antitoxin StbD
MVCFARIDVIEFQGARMDAVLAETSIGITELKKNPSAVIRDAGTETVVVLHHNKPSAYLVPARTYEALMDVLDDLQLVPIVQQRIKVWESDPTNVISMSREELAREARGATRATKPTMASDLKRNTAKPTTSKTRKK